MVGARLDLLRRMSRHRGAELSVVDDPVLRSVFDNASGRFQLALQLAGLHSYIVSIFAYYCLYRIYGKEERDSTWRSPASGAERTTGHTDGYGWSTVFRPTCCDYGSGDRGARLDYFLDSLLAGLAGSAEVVFKLEAKPELG